MVFGVWHCLPPEDQSTYTSSTGSLWEPAKDSHRYIICQNYRVRIKAYSPTNPLPEKCCVECVEMLTAEAVLERLNPAHLGWTEIDRTNILRGGSIITGRLSANPNIQDIPRKRR